MSTQVLLEDYSVNDTSVRVAPAPNGRWRARNLNGDVYLADDFAMLADAKAAVESHFGAGGRWEKLNFKIMNFKPFYP